MTEKEKKEEEAKFALDKLMRERIITHVLQIAHVSTDTNDIENIKLQYQRNFEKYVGTYLDVSIVPYQFGNFWFNESGFQFLWRDHRGHICPECLTWKEVVTRLNKMKKEMSV